MPDFDQIEQVLRRYDYRTNPNNDVASVALCVLRDLGYSITRDNWTLFSLYSLEIDDNITHTCISDQQLIAFAYDLCNDYRERDMAALVEYVKERQQIERALRDSHGVVAQDAVSEDDIMQAMASSLHEIGKAGARTGKAFRDALLSMKTERDLEDCGYEAAWLGDKQKESAPMCDCSERLETLSERVERLERAGKSKDVVHGGPIWVIDPNSTQVSTGSGNVTISPDDSIRITSDNMSNWNNAFTASATAYGQFSDNVSRWSSVSTTPEVWVERNKLVAEISRRAELWAMHADAASNDGKRHKAERYRNNARVLQCLADDIAAGNLFNE